MKGLSAPAAVHLETVDSFYAQPRPQRRLSPYYARLLAATYNLLISDADRVLEVGCGDGTLLARLRGRVRWGVDLSVTQIAAARGRHSGIEFRVGTAESLELDTDPFDVIVLSDVLNQVADVDRVLRQLHACSHAGTRVLINIHNTLWRPFLHLGRALGLARSVPDGSWLSRRDVANLCWLADWETFKSFGRIICPLPVPGVARGANRWLAPLATWPCLAIFLVARRVGLPRRAARRVSVVVPARNEAGNIRQVVARMPRLADETEIVFIEGHSQDDTWAEISALPDRHAHGSIVKLRQSGRGKANAVIEAFRQASGDILMILDADLTVPPEDLPKFVDVLVSGKADFANGVRLVYPLDEQAMQWANLCANKAFGVLFSWLLGQSVKDTLCGTKALWRCDYLRLDANRSYFGDFDPFGDFDLLFGADKLNLRILDVPVRYQQRTYGQTNIHRWRHGVLLLRMVLFAARRLKFVQAAPSPVGGRTCRAPEPVPDERRGQR